MAIVIEVVNLGNKKDPSIRALAGISKSKADKWDRRKVSYRHESSKLLHAWFELDDVHEVLDDLVQAAFDLGRTFERTAGGEYPIGVSD